MKIPQVILDSLTDHLKTSIQNTAYVGGGDINQAARVDTSDDAFFVKWNYQSPPYMFSTEKRGLQLLAGAGALRVPEVILHREDSTPPFLVLEWIAPQQPQDRSAFAERLGEGLADLHQQTQTQHGLDHDNYIGSLPQKNTLTANWASFYADLRIGAQMKIARQRGKLPPTREKLLNNLRKRLPDLVPSEPPALLHGDLWGGNYMGTINDEPVIYDPAVYYGHREVELAFTELFGGFPSRFYEAYNAVYPIDSDYQERKVLYQLYPLLVHMNLFGGGYASQVDNIARRYVGA